MNIVGAIGVFFFVAAIIMLIVAKYFPYLIKEGKRGRNIR